MHLIYNIFVRLYLSAIRVAALFNTKASQWVNGRKHIFQKLRESIDKDDEIIWFHVASLGEFEQGRPLMEAVKQNFPRHKILLTFFSPSGYEIKKNYSGADYIFYLPIDTNVNAARFIATVKPKMAIFVKYEFWFNYINELYKNKIPLLMVSVIFRPSQHFFKFYGGWFRRQLKKVTWLYVQNNQSVKLLNSIYIHHADKSGDTRFDRVKALAAEPYNLTAVEQFKGNNLLLVAGSTWPADEGILKYVLNNTNIPFRLIVAPHVVSDAHINELINKFNAWNPVLYTNAEKPIPADTKVMILNTIGVLSHVYRYADISYVGGGFGVGIHNLLEPATFGMPVIFGPNYSKFQEASDIIDQEAGFSISDNKEALKIINTLLSDNTLRTTLGNKLKNYIDDNAGATDIILHKIKEFIVEPSAGNKL